MNIYRRVSHALASVATVASSYRRQTVAHQYLPSRIPRSGERSYRRVSHALASVATVASSAVSGEMRGNNAFHS